VPDIDVKALIRSTAAELAAVGIDSGEAEAELILCDLLDCDRVHLYLDGSQIINDDILRQFLATIEMRKTRRPLQYLLGSAWFYGRKFLVDQSVMVPCPETELLVETALRIARHISAETIRVLDVGTGSGVVAITLQAERPELNITATDISASALRTAKRNAECLVPDSGITFVQSHIFEALARRTPFHIIVTNPPYIAEPDRETLPPEVLADPPQALFAGADGLDIIRKLIAEAPDHLTRPGHLLFEIGYNQAQAVFELVQDDSRYDTCMLLKDLNDIDRVVICRVQ
jgi:release factor glutamine methyltransferase